MPRKNRSRRDRLPNIVDGSTVKPLPLPDDDDFDASLAARWYQEKLDEIKVLGIDKDRYLLDLEEDDAADESGDR